jgi:hypothetical protein
MLQIRGAWPGAHGPGRMARGASPGAHGPGRMARGAWPGGEHGLDLTSAPPMPVELRPTSWLLDGDPASRTTRRPHGRPREACAPANA